MGLLDVRGVTKRFGGLTAVRDVSLTVQDGDIVGLIGPNGAGKTTLFNLISGVYKPDTGRVLFRDHDITRLPLHETALRGLVRTFQLSSLFMEMTVFENALVGTYRAAGFNVLSAVIGTGTDRRQASWAADKAREALEFMRLDQLRETLARALPYGHQKSLSVAVALACSPTLLLLDEPMAGLNDTETRIMMEDLRRIRESGLSMVIVEHNMTAVMAMSNRIAVLNFGQKIAEGSAEEVRADKDVVEAYLGSEDFALERLE